SVVPPTCQQMEPAETPASTTPASQARRRLWSRPCSRHRASRFATLPPPTQTTSCASSRPVMSSVLGMEKRFRWDTVMPCAWPAGGRPRRSWRQGTARLASGQQPVPGDGLGEDLGELALYVACVRLDVLAHPVPGPGRVVPGDRRVDLLVGPQDGGLAVAGV